MQIFSAAMRRIIHEEAKFKVCLQYATCATPVCMRVAYILEAPFDKLEF
jgi:hypothetical protein